MQQFLSCDWGTSRFRLRLIDLKNNRIIAETGTAQGIQAIASAHPAKAERLTMIEEVLQRGIESLALNGQTDISVVISGMASSTLGWHPLPYAKLPAPIDGRTFRYLDFQQAGRKIRLVSGLQANCDVMRGEETELIGLFAAPARRPLAENCVVVLPGTHSKHVRLSSGNIVDFTTYLTGELYGLLCQNSTLDTSNDSIFDPAAFVAGAHASKIHGLSAALFQTRARTLLGHLAARHNRSFLSGVLIGAEVAAFTGASTDQIVLAAGEQLASQYTLALSELLPDAVVVQIPPAELAASTVMGHSMILSYP